jgi:Protein of unknown function DUF262.
MLDKKLNHDNQAEIEDEELYADGNTMEFVSPFDPRQVNIDSKPMVISNIVERLKHGEIELDPDFQRNANIWNNEKQSRLIESLLIRIPLPTFYFDMVDDEKLIVVDGLQRLSAIKNFMATDSESSDCLKLENLEYLKDLEGLSFEMLPPNLKRRLREETIQTYVIKAGTPDKVRNSIFERINTGGLVLTPAEIKNSVYRGRASSFVKKLAETREFVDATNGKVNSERMLDREFVNRFLAFYLLDRNEYHENLEDYLKDVLIKIKNDKSVELGRIEADFKQALVLSQNIFGQQAFRKKMKNNRYGKINKPLYEAVTVEFAKISKDKAKKLMDNKDLFLEKYNEVLGDEKFIKVITNGTARLESVNYRHDAIINIIDVVIGGIDD